MRQVCGCPAAGIGKFLFCLCRNGEPVVQDSLELASASAGTFILSPSESSPPTILRQVKGQFLVAWKSSGCRKHVELIISVFIYFLSEFKKQIYFVKTVNKFFLTCKWWRMWSRPLLSAHTNFIRFINCVSELQRRCTAERLSYSLIKLCSWGGDEFCKCVVSVLVRAADGTCRLQGNAVLSVQSFQDKSTENASSQHSWSYLKNITHYIIWQSLTPNLLKSRKNTPEGSKCHLWASASVSSLKRWNSLQSQRLLTVQVSATAKAPIRRLTGVAADDEAGCWGCTGEDEDNEGDDPTNTKRCD